MPAQSWSFCCNFTLLLDFLFVFQPTQCSMERAVCISLDSFWWDLLTRILSTVWVWLPLEVHIRGTFFFSFWSWRKQDLSCPLPKRFGQSRLLPQKVRPIPPTPLRKSDESCSDPQQVCSILTTGAGSWPIPPTVHVFDKFDHHTRSERLTNGEQSCRTFGQSCLVLQKM